MCPDNTLTISHKTSASQPLTKAWHLQMLTTGFGRGIRFIWAGKVIYGDGSGLWQLPGPTLSGTHGCRRSLPALPAQRS